ncbi:hypothetical protein [Clostridium sp.]|uniref:hypothetical protein n=1 Tax=Clostridium sp. TaxID=1506 RepID=UPI003F36113A
MRVKLTGIKRNGEIEVAYTKINKYNYKQILRDIDTIINLEDTSVILGDDTPSLKLVFEEEGLACDNMKIEIVK